MLFTSHNTIAFIVPRYFEGSTELFATGKVEKVVNKNLYKPKTSALVRDMIAKNITREIEFYNYCKQRLHKQYLSILWKKIKQEVLWEAKSRLKTQMRNKQNATLGGYNFQNMFSFMAVRQQTLKPFQNKDIHPSPQAHILNYKNLVQLLTIIETRNLLFF